MKVRRGVVAGRVWITEVVVDHEIVDPLVATGVGQRVVNNHDRSRLTINSLTGLVSLRPNIGDSIVFDQVVAAICEDAFRLALAGLVAPDIFDNVAYNPRVFPVVDKPALPFALFLN
jgi:hypothetical protein